MAYSVIVDRHQGELGFDSVEGEGTTFWIRLPMLEDFDPDSSAPAEPGAGT